MSDIFYVSHVKCHQQSRAFSNLNIAISISVYIIIYVHVHSYNIYPSVVRQIIFSVHKEIVLSKCRYYRAYTYKHQSAYFSL